MAARLPTVGGDDGNWGQILNDFLSVEHNADGTLKDNSVRNSVIADGVVTVSKMSSGVQASLIKADNVTGDNVKNFGAFGDGNTDDTAAINAAVTSWLIKLGAGKNAALIFPPGAYVVSNQITISPLPSGGNINGGIIIGDGAILKFIGATGSVALLITTVGGTKTWNRLLLRGLHVDGGGVLVRAGTASIYGVAIDEIYITPRGLVAPLELSGVFESQVINCRLDFDPTITPTAVSHSCIYIHKESGFMQPSSIDIIAPTTRGGYNGIYSVNGVDTKVRGGTILQAWREGIYLIGPGCSVDGIHLENNWLSGVSTDAAAVRLDGSGSVRSIYVIAHPGVSVAPYNGSSSQNYAVRCYVFSVDIPGNAIAGVLEVSDVTHVSSVSGARDLRCTGGQNGSTLIMRGISSRSISAITSGKIITLGSTTSSDPALDIEGGSLALNGTTVDALVPSLITTVVQTASYNANANELVPVDTTSAPFAITLPSNPIDKTRIIVKKINSSGNDATVLASGTNVFNKVGGPTSIALSLVNQAVTIQYASGIGVWYVVGDDLPLSGLDARYAQSVSPSLLVSGEATFDPRLGVAITLATQRLQLTYFTALRTETCTQIVCYTAGNAAGATPSLCQMALYSVDASDNLTLIASTPNDTTLFALANTRYAKATSASFTKIQGQRYAVAILVVSSATVPSIYGNGGMGGTGLVFNTLPRRQGRVGSQTSLPASISAGTVTIESNGFYMELMP
jgi:hypothetical protein